jgi:hypothetical protein
MKPAVLIDLIEDSLKKNNWSTALDLTLKIPSIMGTIDYPTLHPHKRYSLWFDKYVGKKYKRISKFLRKEKFVFSGKDCYSFYTLCVTGDLFLLSNDVNKKFEFVTPKHNVFQHLLKTDNKILIQIDYFCNDILDGVKYWMRELTPNLQTNSTAMIERSVA